MTRTVKGYRVLSIPLHVACYDESIPRNVLSCAVHPLYIKAHAERSDNGFHSSGKAGSSSSSGSSSGGGGRLLFVGNVDYGRARSAEEIAQYLTAIFSQFGDIRNIAVSVDTVSKSNHGNVSGGDWADALDQQGTIAAKVTRFAHIQFNKKSAVKYALTAEETEFTDSFHVVTAQFGYNFNFKTAAATADPSAAESAPEDVGYTISQQQQQQHGVNGVSKGQVKFATRTEKIRETLIDAHPFVAVDVEALRRQVDGYMRQFDEGEERARVDRERAASAPDDDGFVLVSSRNKRKRGGDEMGSETGKLTATGYKSGSSAGRKKKKGGAGGTGSGVLSSSNTATAGGGSGGGLRDFYRFQLREDKAARLQELRHKFAEDKERVARLKEHQQRKFKPFS